MTATEFKSTNFISDQRITELTGYTPPIDTDVLPVVDITTATTKKITWANLKATIRTYLLGTVSSWSAVQTFASAILTTPQINGLSTGTGVASAATVSTIMLRDANGNVNIVNLIEGFRTTATAGATTTLTITDTFIQFFTGSSVQTVKLPTTGIVAGQQYLIVNQSSGLVTVQSSGANTIAILGANTSIIVTAVVATPTTAANWGYSYAGANVASGKVLTVNQTITLVGTDAKTYTFPTTDATIARTDSAQSFTGVQTFVAPILGTPTSGTLTNCTGLPAAGVVAGTFSGQFTLAKPVLNGTDPTGASYTPSSGSQTVALDVSANNIHIVTGHASGTAITFTITGATNNQIFTVTIKQGAVVSTIASWFAGISWVGGVTPTLTATINKTDMFIFMRTGSNTYLGYTIGQNS